MKTFEVPSLDIDPEPTFNGIPDDEFDKTIEELDQRLEERMLDNTIAEANSILYAKEFHCSSPADSSRTLRYTPEPSNNHKKNK